MTIQEKNTFLKNLQERFLKMCLINQLNQTFVNQIENFFLLGLVDI
jgi:hypothetical protein